MPLARPMLPRLILLCALTLAVSAAGQPAWSQPTPPTAPRVATPAAVTRPGNPRQPPIVTAPRQPNAQRPAAQPPRATAPVLPLPPPPVPPTEAPQAGATPEAPAGPAKGTSTGHPLPRFAALRSDEVNFRAGPGQRYPIEWTYKRRDLPVQIEREFEVWRLVRDAEGTRGWVHVATLTTRRSFIVTGTERVLRRQATDDASPVAKLQPGVIGFIRTCRADAAWCQLQVGDHRGWLKRDEFWGTLPKEAVN